MKPESSPKACDVAGDASRKALLEALEALAALCDAFPELTSPSRNAVVRALRRAFARSRLKSMIRLH